MKTTGTTPRRKPNMAARALSYTEVLVASCVCVFCLSVMVQLFSVTSGISTHGVDNTQAFNLQRQTMEQVIETGFTNTPEALTTAPVTHYYGLNSVNMDSSPAAARYKVTTSVVSSATIAGSNPVQPALTATRLVTVTVYLVANGSQLCTASTYLIRGGL
jgi:hypothetical protein